MSDIKRTYTKKELSGYLVGMFGQNLIYNIVATGLYFYFQNVICLPAMALGWIFALARVWDAVNDPMMGTIVDKTRTKWGKCRPYLIIFPAIIGIVTILCFINGNYATADSSTQKFFIVAWAAVSYVAWGMVFTVCDIPLWGVTSLMTEDQNDRSKILSLARIIAGVGGIGVLIVQVAQALVGVFTAKGYDNAKATQYAFILVAVIMTAVASLLFEIAGLSVRERVDTSNEKKYTFVENFKIMFGNKPFRQILISGILRSPIYLQMIIMMTLVTYYYTNNNLMNVIITNENGDFAGINFKMLLGVLAVAAGLFIGQFVTMGITPVLIKKIEKKTLYNFYSVVGAIPYILIFVFFKVAGDGLRTNIVWMLLTFVAFLGSGAAMGGISVLQSVMIADCVDYEEYHNGVRTDGVFFSGQSFIVKLSSGIATIISAFVYKIVGYSDVNIAKLNDALANGADFATYDGGTGVGKYAAAMFFLVSIPPAIGMILSAIPTAKYALSDDEHTRILDELVRRRASASAAQEPAQDTDSAAAALENNMDEIVDEINKLD
ncbi:MAG: MFS transporter [Eubacteriales bacterium]|nr:MFS transporter [Eubacteriales bacterium]